MLNCESESCILLLNLKFSIWTILCWTCNVYLSNLVMLKIIFFIGNIYDCKRYVCIRDVGYTVEHIPELPDLILFLTNYVSYSWLKYELTRGTFLVRACVSSHLNNNNRWFVLKWYQLRRFLQPLPLGAGTSRREQARPGRRPVRAAGS
jgi:hypothetical protein